MRRKKKIPRILATFSRHHSKYHISTTTSLTSSKFSASNNFELRNRENEPPAERAFIGFLTARLCSERRKRVQQDLPQRRDQFGEGAWQFALFYSRLFTGDFPALSRGGRDGVCPRRSWTNKCCQVVGNYELPSARRGEKGKLVFFVSCFLQDTATPSCFSECTVYFIHRNSGRRPPRPKSNPRPSPFSCRSAATFKPPSEKT